MCLNDVLKLLEGLKIIKITPNGKCNRRPFHESFNKLCTVNTTQLLINLSMHIMEKAFGNNQWHSWGFGRLGQVNTKVTPTEIMNFKKIYEFPYIQHSDLKFLKC